MAIIVNICLGVWSINRDSQGKNAAGLSADVQRQLALKLEKQELNTASISAWKQYLTANRLNGKEEAMIWYRIGKLYQKKGQYEEALAGYYRSEGVAPVKEISSEISRRVQECLESLGKFADLRYELSQRVGMESSTAINKKGKKDNGDAGQDKILAEIGPEKITISDLDRWIDQQIGRQLSQMAPYLPDGQLKKEKERLFKQFSSTSRRKTILNQLVMEEILYRKSREARLLDDPKIQAELRQQEHSLLARTLIEKEFKDKIHITDSDLTTYYKAHKEAYMTQADDKEKPRQKTFDEVKNEIFQRVRSDKQRDVQETLVHQLQETYDVVVHRSALPQDKTEKDSAGPPASPKNGTQG